MKVFLNKRLKESIDPYKISNLKAYSKALEQETSSLAKRKVFVDALISKPTSIADEINKALYKTTKVAIDATKVKINTMPNSGAEFPVVVIEIGNKLVDDAGNIQTGVSGSCKFTFGGLKCEAKQKDKRIVVWTELDKLSSSVVDDLL